MNANGSPAGRSDEAAPVDRFGSSFSWREAGRGTDRVPVLLLHGLTGSRLAWEPQLVSIGTIRRTAAWDLPGYGASTPLRDPVTFEALADAVVRCADEIGLDRFHLVGLSFGGMIAQYTAARHASRIVSLALLATSPKFGLDGTDPAVWRTARMAQLDAGAEPVDFAPAVMRAIGGPRATDEMIESQVRASELVPGRALREAIDVLITHDSRGLLPHISTPTVCIAGELDAETPVAYLRAIADALPKSRLVVVPGAGHLIHVEAADAVNALLLEHFDATEAAA